MMGLGWGGVEWDGEFRTFLGLAHMIDATSHVAMLTFVGLVHMVHV